METKVVKSGRGKLNFRDVGKGLIMAFLASALTFVYDTIDLGFDALDYRAIIKAGIIGIVTYLFKNGILEPPKTIVIASDNKELESNTKTIKKNL